MIISIGEVVWDIFAERQVLGGAPVNVACHLQSLGVEVEVVTRIGADTLGARTRTRLAELGLSLAGVQEDPLLPTGQVTVSTDSRGEPRFDIVAPAAWDNIDADEAAWLVGDRSYALVFGTLAQRAQQSRETIRRLWAGAELCFYDVNLRPPFTPRETVLDSLAAADLVKMNEGELLAVADWLGMAGEKKKNIAQALCARHDLVALAVTEGSRGAWLLAGNDCFFQEAEEVLVQDTVGAGDAFFAALIAGYLAREPWPEVLARANRRGACVAARQGATPPMPHLREDTG